MTEAPKRFPPHEPDCTCGEEDGYEGCYQSPMGDDMLDWLRANKVDLMRIPMFPEVVFLPGDRMRIEYIYGLEATPKRRVLVMHTPATRMVEMPVLVPMPQELWGVYTALRKADAADRVLKRLGEFGATVVAVQPGSHLTFVTSAMLDEDQEVLAEGRRSLEEAFPGVEIHIMTGTEAVLLGQPRSAGTS